MAASVYIVFMQVEFDSNHLLSDDSCILDEVTDFNILLYSSSHEESSNPTLIIEQLSAACDTNNKSSNPQTATIQRVEVN